MKNISKLFYGLMVVAVLFSGVSVVNNATAATIEICHQDNGWMYMETPNQSSLDGHLGHGDFLYFGPPVQKNSDIDEAAANAWCEANVPTTPTTGTLTINKVISGQTQSNADDFSFQINGGSSTAFEADGSNAVVLTLANGPFTVTEVSPGAEFTVSYSDCSNINLTAAGATCTITNTVVVDACPNETTDPGVQTSGPCNSDDVCPNVTGIQTTQPCADTVCENQGGTWDEVNQECDFPPGTPVVSIEKTVVSSGYRPQWGDTQLIYTIEWSVTGGDTTGLVITDVLPSGTFLINNPDIPTPVPAPDSTDPLTWNLGAQDADSEGTITFKVEAIHAQTCEVTNTATANYTYGNGGAGVASDDVTSVLAGGPCDETDLSVTKTVSDNTPDEGQSLTYTVTVTNNGTDDATGVVVNDLLPAGLTYVTHATAEGNYDQNTGVWTIGNLANGVSAVLSIGVTVNAGTAGTTIDNTATVDGNETDNDPTDDSATASITVNVGQGPQRYTLTITTNGEGNGLVVGNGINCDTNFVASEEQPSNDCSETYDENTVVNLSVTPDEGSTFDGSWSTTLGNPGTCTGTNTNCSVTMSGNVTLNAHFGVNGGGGGGGGSSTSGSRRSGGSVLGAATDVCGWDTQYLRRSWGGNVPTEVQTMQNFLNLHMNAGLVVDNTFGPKTEAAVKAFQALYMADILTPWGISQPTGIWYISTTTKAKEIMCGEKTALPPLINWSQNPLVSVR